MTLPVPPDSPETEEAAVPANPWAPPDSDRLTAAQVTAPPAGPYWPPFPVPVPQPRNGQGIAALVLGIIGAVLSLPLVLFWFSWLPALLAVVFGAVGLRLARRRLATNRAMALTGTVLGAVGLTVSAVTGGFVVSEVRDAARAHDRAVAERRRDEAERQRLADERAKKTAAEQEARAADERARRLPAGGTYTFPDGLKVTMAPPAPAAPSTSGTPLPENATFVRLRVTVVNTGSTELSLYGSALLIVKDSRGTLLHPLFGGGQYVQLPKSLAPGQESTALETYGLPNATADPFTLQFTHGSGLDRKDVIWTGTPPRRPPPRRPAP
ncbi:DUF4190 domain-containing protein [Kitasatospora sp. NPDC059646]|uniref:DUF4190 domain-containing protein n=1 Tax=Kitasatospora sp. NPDC059646 TaxID=3346893 RepID=UPI0036CC76B3